jgi:hypothetical protein
MQQNNNVVLNVCCPDVGIIIMFYTDQPIPSNSSFAGTMMPIQMFGIGSSQYDTEFGLTYEYNQRLCFKNNKPLTFNINYAETKKSFHFSSNIKTVFFDDNKVSFSKEEPIFLFVSKDGTIDCYNSYMFSRKFCLRLKDVLYSQQHTHEFMQQICNNSSCSNNKL